MRNTLYCFLLLLFVSIRTTAQDLPFANDIREFKKMDSISAPPQNAILFIGSSSFTLWKDVADYFPGHTIVNRGFGGSQLTDVIRYSNDIIVPYRPAQVVIYCGENDISSSDAIAATTVVKRFEQLYSIIRNRFPGAGIVYVSMKPSPSRKKFMPKMVEANARIRHFLQGKRNTAFIDVYSKMLDRNGEPLKDIYLDDSLHMNAKGYAIWQKEIKPYLLKQ
ncbi:GDSL-type esterase/lipase family protein [Flavihumibacter solisilvae]|nr:GDSL-type esterase/lipase family protein [Flavihumibacter solisilvae]